MIRTSQEGAINVLLFPLIVVVLLLVGAGAFGVWAYGQRQDYKNNSDQKSAAAVSAALKVEDAKKEAEFAEVSKSPLKIYSGPVAYGSVKISFPKTWSAYVDESGANTAGVDGYFYPNFVPATTNQGISYALRMQVLNQAYSATLQQFSGQVQAGALNVSPYTLPKLPAVVGSRVRGDLGDNKIVDMVVLPLRDKTVQIWTEGNDFEGDFNTYILPNASFSP